MQPEEIQQTANVPTWRMSEVALSLPQEQRFERIWTLLRAYRDWRHALVPTQAIVDKSEKIFCNEMHEFLDLVAYLSKKTGFDPHSVELHEALGPLALEGINVVHDLYDCFYGFPDRREFGAQKLQDLENLLQRSKEYQEHIARGETELAGLVAVTGLECFQIQPRELVAFLVRRAGVKTPNGWAEKAEQYISNNKTIAGVTKVIEQLAKASKPSR